MICSDKTLYNNSLGIALVLMLFFACYFLLAKTPDKRIFANYLKSRRLMAGALLTLVFRPSVLVARGGCHDEPLHLLHYLLVLQLRVSDATQSSLFHGQTVSLVHRGLDGLRSHFHSCSAISAQGRPPTGGHTAHGSMACSQRYLSVV